DAEYAPAYEAHAQPVRPRHQVESEPNRAEPFDHTARAAGEDALHHMSAIVAGPGLGAALLGESDVERPAAGRRDTHRLRDKRDERPPPAGDDRLATRPGVGADVVQRADRRRQRLEGVAHRAGVERRRKVAFRNLMP